MKLTGVADPPEPPDEPEEQPPEYQAPRPAVRRLSVPVWFRENPWVGIVATICTIIALPLSVYFYFASQRTRDLQYYVHPVKSVIVRAGVSSNLKVTFKDRELTSDITAIQVQLWNAGNESNRKENILDGITVLTSPQSPILEATIQRHIRALTEITLDSSQIADGRAGLSWKILEQGDGAMLQLICVGQPKEITLFGAIEGQHTIGRWRGSTDPREKQRRRLALFLPLFSCLFGVGLLLMASAKAKLDREYRQHLIDRIAELEQYMNRTTNPSPKVDDVLRELNIQLSAISGRRTLQVLLTLAGACAIMFFAVGLYLFWQPAPPFGA